METHSTHRRANAGIGDGVLTVKKMAGHVGSSDDDGTGCRVTGAGSGCVVVC